MAITKKNSIGSWQSHIIWMMRDSTGSMINVFVQFSLNSANRNIRRSIVLVDVTNQKALGTCKESLCIVSPLSASYFFSLSYRKRMIRIGKNEKKKCRINTRRHSFLRVVKGMCCLNETNTSTNFSFIRNILGIERSTLTHFVFVLSDFVLISIEKKISTKSSEERNVKISFIHRWYFLHC